MGIQTEMAMLRQGGMGRFAGLLLATSLVAISGAEALEPGAFEDILTEIKAHPPRALEDLPKAKFDLMRRMFREYTMRRPSYLSMKAAPPCIFDRDIADAMVLIGQRCVGRTSSFVLDLFGKPHSIAVGPHNFIDLQFRMTVMRSLWIRLRRDVVVGAESHCMSIYFCTDLRDMEEAIRPGECAIRPGKWEQEFQRYDLAVQRAIEAIVANRWTSRTQVPELHVSILRIALNLYFSQIGSTGGTEVQVWNKTMADAFTRLLGLCKQEDVCVVLDLFGKPTALREFGPDKWALTYHFSEDKKADLYFGHDSKLAEVVVRDVVEEK